MMMMTKITLFLSIIVCECLIIWKKEKERKSAWKKKRTMMQIM